MDGQPISCSRLRIVSQYTLLATDITLRSSQELELQAKRLLGANDEALTDVHCKTDR
jgi:hypothetical protein